MKVKDVVKMLQEQDQEKECLIFGAEGSSGEVEDITISEDEDGKDGIAENGGPKKKIKKTESSGSLLRKGIKFASEQEFVQFMTGKSKKKKKDKADKEKVKDNADKEKVKDNDTSSKFNVAKIKDIKME